MHLKLPLVFEPQLEGGYTVTSPFLSELITEGDSMEDALENVRDALAAVVEKFAPRMVNVAAVFSMGVVFSVTIGATVTVAVLLLTEAAGLPLELSVTFTQ